MAAAVKWAMYESQNRMAAKIIAGNPAKYPGLMAEWAALILRKEGAARWQERGSGATIQPCKLSSQAAGR